MGLFAMDPQDCMAALVLLSPSFACSSLLRFHPPLPPLSLQQAHLLSFFVLPIWPSSVPILCSHRRHQSRCHRSGCSPRLLSYYILTKPNPNPSHTLPDLTWAVASAIPVNGSLHVVLLDSLNDFSPWTAELWASSGQMMEPCELFSSIRMAVKGKEAGAISKLLWFSSGNPQEP